MYIILEQSSMLTALNLSRLNFPAGKRDFSLSQASRLALGPTQSPIEWAEGVK